MGLTYVEGVVTGPSGTSRAVRFMVDSGAKYSLLPPADWRAIGLAPKRRMTFALADGTLIDRDVSECHIALPQGEEHTPVILGEAGDEALLRPEPVQPDPPAGPAPARLIYAGPTTPM